jgi:hypothetical protein
MKQRQARSSKPTHDRFTRDPIDASISNESSQRPVAGSKAIAIESAKLSLRSGTSAHGRCRWLTERIPDDRLGGISPEKSSVSRCGKHAQISVDTLRFADMMAPLSAPAT